MFSFSLYFGMCLCAVQIRERNESNQINRKIELRIRLASCCVCVFGGE